MSIMHRLSVLVVFAWCFMLGSAACNPTPTPPAPPVADAASPTPEAPVAQAAAPSGSRLERIAAMRTRAGTSKPIKPSGPVNPRAGCRGADGSWRCKGSEVTALMGANTQGPGNCGAVCTVPAWGYDPGNISGCAADSNSCTTTTCGGVGSGIGPCLSMAQVISRYGTPEPQIATGVTLTVTQLSSAAVGADVFRFNPHVSGGGSFVWLGQPTNVGTTFSPSSITARVVSSSGALLKLVGAFPDAGATAAAPGMIVWNKTRNSYGMVAAATSGSITVTQADTGAGLTTITSFPSLAEDTWSSTSDVYQIQQPVGVNWQNPEFFGGDLNAGPNYSTAWVQGVHFQQPNTSSSMTIKIVGAVASLNLCTFDPYVVFDGFDGSDNGLMYLACDWMPGGATLLGGVAMFSGGLPPSTGVTLGSLGFYLSAVDGDASVWNLYNYGSTGVLGRVLVNNTLYVEYPGTALIASFLSGAGLVYGPGASNVLHGGTIENNAGTAWTTALQVATLQIDSATTAWSLPATGTVTLNGTSAVTITGVNGTNAFPANATFALSINTVGGTPGTSAPYFFTATTANSAQLKSLTVGDNDVYNWEALPTPGVTLSAANLAAYKGMYNPITNSAYLTN